MITLLVACIALSSCETSGLGGSSSAFANQTADYRRTVSEGVQTGAVIGAVGAAAVTLISGGSGQDAARNAIIGGFIGSLIGGAAGKGVAEKKKKYVQKEDALRATIRHARSSNAKLSSLVSTASALVKKRRSEVAKLDRASASEKRALKAAITSDKRTLSQAISAAEKEIAHLKSFKNRISESGSLSSEINAAERGKQKLVQNRATLTDIQEDF